MLASLIFVFNRILEVVTLIPTLGMLAYFVNGYINANALTPNYILVLFIVSVLAAVWAIATLLRRDSTRRSAAFVALIDLAFVGAFIAGVYELRGISSQNCSNASGGLTSSGGVAASGDTVYISPLSINYTPFSLDVNKTCSMLKASFAFGIMNCIFFFVTFVMAYFMHRHERGVVVEKTETVRRRSHESRRGHSRSGSHRRSSRDSRRQYYV
ncbi:hypothetical protein MMC30_004642 [Trapelia coarctata]|nr:hypothetical protein [Trapelia coarctata]